MLSFIEFGLNEVTNCDEKSVEYFKYFFMKIVSLLQADVLDQTLYEKYKLKLLETKTNQDNKAKYHEVFETIEDSANQHYVKIEPNKPLDKQTISRIESLPVIKEPEKDESPDVSTGITINAKLPFDQINNVSNIDEKTTLTEPHNVGYSEFEKNKEILNSLDTMKVLGKIFEQLKKDA